MLSHDLYENDYQMTVGNGGEQAHMCLGAIVCGVEAHTCLVVTVHGKQAHMCLGALCVFLREMAMQSLGLFLIELDFFFIVTL